LIVIHEKTKQPLRIKVMGLLAVPLDHIEIRKTGYTVETADRQCQELRAICTVTTASGQRSVVIYLKKNRNFKKIMKSS
jgi:hypothetical protein